MGHTRFLPGRSAGWLPGGSELAVAGSAVFMRRVRVDARDSRGRRHERPRRQYGESCSYTLDPPSSSYRQKQNGLTVKRPSTARLSPRRRLPAYLLLEDQVARRSFTNARSRKSDWGGDRARTGVGMGCPLQQRRECALDLGHRRRGGVVCVLISSSYHDHHSYRPSHGELPPTSAKVRPRVLRILGARLSFSPVLRLAPPPPSLTSSAFYHSKSPTCLP